LFLQANFHFDEKLTSTIFSSFLMLVYFLPLFGGMLADKFGYSKMVTIGIFVMFVGYVLLALPLGANTLAIIVMAASLLFVSLGTGLFKGNLQVMVGDLYNDPRYADKRDSGFSLFYMAINIGAMFAPTAAIEIMKWSQETFGVSEADSYHYAFAVACASLVFSIAIYYLGMGTFRQVITTTKKKDAAATNEPQAEELSPSETRERITCLILVMAVVVFFWMAFHQNGLTLTFFARDYTATSSSGVQAMMFDVTNLVAAIFMVFGAFALFQSKEAKGKLSGAALILAPAAYLYWNYQQLPESISISAPIFQQFNACFVVMLTPVSIALFGWLGKKGKEPKAPVKIGLGMLVAACAYLLMIAGSIGLPVPTYTNGVNDHMANVTPNLLVSTYLVLTFAELLLSPIGISFVSKVAPPKYKGMMMGAWFVSTALGNFLVQIPGYLWGMDLTIVWGVLAAICVVAALFIFSIIKKLNKVS
ncbi:MAG: peptide MFS transporter, partial [Alloprevotella sp.]|nr:peptide MFS transporter [Alloprevotella sp.]